MTELTLRRLRDNPHVRELTRTVQLDYRQMIQPLFVVEGIDEKEPIPGIPRTYRETPETLVKQIESDLKNGVTKFLLFGVGEAHDTHNFDFSFTCKQIKAIKERFGKELWLAVDLCLCSSTTHGHCGVLNSEGDHVLNKPSVDALAQAALEFAESGADCIAPSDMMDGRVGAIRDLLDRHDLEKVSVLSYSAKFASSFYGPFRVACDSSPSKDSAVKLHDRCTYQIDPANRSDALRSVERDIIEGADMIMVKPATHYLDIIQTVKQSYNMPVACYYVSGEHALVEASAEKGYISSAKAGHIENWIAMKRAGTDIIITYEARQAKAWLSDQ